MKWVENPPAAVLATNHFNPTVASQMWLAQQGILDAGGTVKAGSLFTDDVVQAVTEDFTLLVLAEQVQLLLPTHGRHRDVVTEKLGTLVQRLPHVPYRALGLNFNWHLVPDNEDVGELTRRMFAGPGHPLFARFGDPAARFGSYMSRDFDPFRMKLDIKPIRVMAPPEQQDGPQYEQERVQFVFNFHLDIPPGPGAVDQITHNLQRWDDVRQEAIETLRPAGYEAQS